MKTSHYVISAAFVGWAILGSACTERAGDETKIATGKAVNKTRAGTDKALDETSKGVDKALDATRTGTATAIDETQRAVDKSADATKSETDRVAGKTKAIVHEVVTKTKKVTSTTGEVITDAWLTTKVKAKFADEMLLRGSDISVDTDDQVVTLKGTVTSAAAKNRAAVIARGSEGVNHVVNALVVK